MPLEPVTSGGDAIDEQILAALFESAGPIGTPTPGIKAWVASDPMSPGGARLAWIKRMLAGQGKGRATQALSLCHPAIVPTRRWLIEGGRLYVIRDAVKGKNLRQSLIGPGGARPSAELMRNLLMPVLDALEYAHGKGAVHGGISADNILISENGDIVVTDWATADPSAPQHKAAYAGAATVVGDVRALGHVLSAYLPTTGAFASPAVRGRIEGVIRRCETLADLRETLNTLEKLADAPMPSGGGGTVGSGGSTSGGGGLPPGRMTEAVRSMTASVPPEHRSAEWALQPGPPFSTDPPPPETAPVLTTQLLEKIPRIAQGGGGTATLIVRNEGSAPLVIRMVATQHQWLNVRPMELPLKIPPRGVQRIEFFLSAARLKPGEYRSEVYLSANANGDSAEDLRSGWFKHTSEVRVVVDETAGVRPGPPPASGGGLPYPPNSPRLPAMPGCAGIFSTMVAGLLSLFGVCLWIVGARGGRLP